MQCADWEEVHDAKLQALESIIEEAAGAPVLVAYHFQSDLARLLKAFPRGRHLDKNPQTVRDWNAGKIPVLFAHPASAGHGLNLQDGGNVLVVFGHWWDLEQYQQIVGRIGLSKTTLYDMIRRGAFPPSQKIGLRATGWRESLVSAWIAGTWQPVLDEKEGVAVQCVSPHTVTKKDAP